MYFLNVSAFLKGELNLSEYYRIDWPYLKEIDGLFIIGKYLELLPVHCRKTRKEKKSKIRKNLKAHLSKTNNHC